jgi:N-acetylglucosaminyldiphosphoundecaprenol N-acetyl-beta-D-mannosaminyltransferase
MNSSIKILGNRIDCIQGYHELYASVLENLVPNTSGKGYVTVNNVHTMIEGFRDQSFQKVINNSFLSIPDGKPLQIVGKLKGNKDISRLFGPTVMESFIDWGRKDNIRHFFFGSTEENLQKLKAVVEKKYPGTRIVGMISPPYRPFNEWDNEKFIEQINKAQPDFIWIGLGAPKQERWMYEQHKNIGQGVLFGIGAGFDYMSGNIKHAPKWMKNSSLEWLYRLVQEPNRLWKRYLTTIPPFIFFASFELLGIKFKK